MMISSIAPAIQGKFEQVQRSLQPSASVAEDFMASLQAAGQSAVQSINNAEAQSLSGISGQASTRDVVEAIMSAEQTLRVATGIRDKIVSAYLELSRMAI